MSKVQPPKPRSNGKAVARRTNTTNVDARFRRVAWERVTKIDDLLRARKYPNCVQMAKDFGVSVRTLKRDIQFMIERRNLPIKYDDKTLGLLL